MKLTPKIQKAINKAAILHYSQKRKTDNLPYVVHPYSVAFILSRYTNNEDIIVAGLLHDVLEDVSNYDKNKLREDFGERVCKIVEELSEEKDPSFTRKKEKDTWQRRKDKYLEHLKAASFEAMMVCAADKIHNLSSLIDAYKKKRNKIERNFNAPLNRNLWFHREVFKILNKKLNNKIVEELGRVYGEAESLIGGS